MLSFDQPAIRCHTPPPFSSLPLSTISRFCTQQAGLVDLPLEVLAEVVDFVADPEDLLACRLACHALCDAVGLSSAFALEVTLDDEAVAPPYSFGEWLLGPPHAVGKSVRTLDMDRVFPDYLPDPDELHEALAVVLPRVATLLLPLVSTPDYLAAVPPGLSALSFEAPWVPSMDLGALSRLGPTLAALRIFSCPDLSTLPLDALPNLLRLALPRSGSQLDPVVDALADSPCAPHLRALDLRSYRWVLRFAV